MKLEKYMADWAAEIPSAPIPKEYAALRAENARLREEQSVERRLGLKLCRQRDAAYERAAEVAEKAGMAETDTDDTEGDYNQGVIDASCAARNAIRALKPLPETK